ncbi:MAG: hypothetical protein COA79_10760 [Planctomycetota bacterium]|nr:MAG: hypothetical protein COA79_10760 [Planctomycetota bacterium]
MIKFKLAKILTLMFAMNICVVSQEKELSLKDCINLAMKNNIALKSSSIQILKSREQLKEAKSGYYPNVDIEGVFRQNDEAVTFITPAVEISPGLTIGPSESEVSPESFYKLYINISQPLYTGGRVSHGVNMTKYLKNAIVLQHTHIKQNIVFQVYRHYFNILRKQNIVSSKKESEQLAKKHLDDTELKDFSKHFKLRAKSKHLQTLSDSVQAQQSLEVSKNELAYFIGYSKKYRLTDTLKFVELNVDITKKIEAANRNRMDFKAMRSGIEALKYKEKIETSYRLPQLVASATGGYQNPEFGELGGEETGDSYWNVQIALRFNLFDGFRRKSRASQINKERLQNYAELKDVKSKAQRDILTISSQIKKMNKIVKLQQQILKVAKENYELVSKGYSLKENTQLQLLDALEQVTTTNRELINAIYFHELAVIRLQLLTGELDPKKIMGAK